MTTEASVREVGLKTGPSREELFDNLKYNQTHKDFAVVDFFTHEYNHKATWGSRLDVAIEGLFKAGDSGREWFFWGRLKHIGSGSTWKPAWEAPDGAHVFGRWNTYHRRGKIAFSDKSFFQSPLSKGLQPFDPDLETDEDRKNEESLQNA
jgi:hypothetical protein